MNIVLSSFRNLVFIIVLTLEIWGSLGDKHENFLHCLSLHSPASDSISKVTYTSINSSYTSVLNSKIHNTRFSATDIRKPQVIITPTQPSHVQASVICSKNHGFQTRTRSGGHDLEGLSYVSEVPFILIDLIHLRSVSIDTLDNTAWVQSGATIGELYYTIGKKSPTLGFPGSIFPSVGAGGFLSGGGYGMMLRKYGLAADNVIDASFVDANGNLVDRKSMGEDLFWAIRGGGGGNFGIILAWKIKLFPVPQTVTVFAVNKIFNQDTAKLVHRWQYVAPKLDENLFIGIFLTAANSRQEGRTVKALFFSLFLGKAEELLSVVQKSFPELGLAKEHCFEMSWIEAMAFHANGFATGYTFTPGKQLDILLDRTLFLNDRLKIKSDYAKEPILETGFEGIWDRFKSGETQRAQLYLIPYGGKMSEISKIETPFPHRAEYLFKLGYYALWKEQSDDERHINWSKELYSYMTPFVSKSPRAAYVNFRDLDIGKNNKHGNTSYDQASIWGHKYYGDNFKKLALVKTKVDPSNVFMHEQSIPLA